MAIGDPKFSIEVFRGNGTSKEKSIGTSVIDILNQEVIYDDVGDARYLVEVFRNDPLPVDTTRNVRITERVMPGGTLSNVGVGPVPPERPYEGQVWILT